MLQDTLAAGRPVGADVAPAGTLPTLRDVDTVDDLKEWLSSVVEHPEQHDAGMELVQCVRRVLQLSAPTAAEGPSSAGT